MWAIFIHSFSEYCFHIFFEGGGIFFPNSWNQANWWLDLYKIDDLGWFLLQNQVKREFESQFRIVYISRYIDPNLMKMVPIESWESQEANFEGIGTWGGVYLEIWAIRIWMPNSRFCEILCLDAKFKKILWFGMIFDA